VEPFFGFILALVGFIVAAQRLMAASRRLGLI
jgi:hypothetical protein